MCSFGLVKMFVGMFKKGFKQFSIFCVLKNKINWKIILEMIVKFCYVWMIYLVHDFDFCFNMIQQILCFYWFLFYLLNCIDGSCFFVSGFPDCSIGPLSKGLHILEIHFEGLYFPSSLDSGWKEHDSVSNFVNFH